MAGEEGLPARCISLLEEVKGLLEGQGNKNMNGVRLDDAGAVSTAVSNEVVRTRPVQSQVSPPESTEPRSERIMQNFRSIFSPYPAGPSTSYAAARNQSRPPPAKKRKSFFRVKETWTHEFFCLASTAATCVPSRSDKISLQNAGLGRRKIVFSCRASALDVKENLESVFPKLKESGGFEILRSAQGTMLSLITPPPGGYSVQFLRDAAGLGQALAYIRPLQKDLDTFTIESTEQVCEPNAPSVQCILCDAKIPMSLLRQHQAGCVTKRKEKPAEEESWATETSHVVEDQSTPSTSSNSAKCGDVCLGSSSASLRELCPDTTSDQTLQSLNRGLGGRSAALRELCPDATTEQILQSLNDSHGDVNLAAQNLLGLSEETTDLENCWEVQDSDDDLLTSVFPSTSTSTPEKMTAPPCTLTPEGALEAFQEANRQDDKPRERFFVNRLEGSEELKKDILSLYKDPRKNLRAAPRVRFEGEEAVGAGPVREFFHCALKIIEEGMHGDGRPILFFEGESDHLLPIHNQILQQMGAFTSIGRIISHSILHGGPGVYGLSPVVKHYWAHGDLGKDPPPIVIEDLPDINLRETILEFQQLNAEEKVSNELRESLSAYMLEAGLEPELLCGGRDILLQGLLWYFVIDKRKLELDDIAKGMNDVSLQMFLMQQPQLLEVVFPPHAAKQIKLSEFLAKVSYENEKEDSGKHARVMFEQYLHEIAQRKEGETRLNDLCCFWTGWDFLPPRREVLIAKFSSNKRSKLPTSETCFLSLVLPVGHETYGDFLNAMDTAIKCGSRGFAYA